MICIQRGIAVVCVFLLLAPLAGAQVPGVTDSGGGSRLFSPYQFRELPPIDLSNSGRLEQLLRGGNIYLSLQDAIALALENNLDIAIQRYGPINADASLLRAKAGGPLRGVPASVQTVTTNILSQVTGTGGGTGGGRRLLLLERRCGRHHHHRDRNVDSQPRPVLLHCGQRGPPLLSPDQLLHHRDDLPGGQQQELQCRLSEGVSHRHVHIGGLVEQQRPDQRVSGTTTTRTRTRIWIW